MLEKTLRTLLGRCAIADKLLYRPKLLRLQVLIVMHSYVCEVFVKCPYYLGRILVVGPSGRGMSIAILSQRSTPFDFFSEFLLAVVY